MNAAVAETNEGSNPVADAPLIQARKVSVEFNQGQPILSDISVSIDRGQTIAIIGESGCGKSTVVLSLMRLLPEAGLQ